METKLLGYEVLISGWITAHLLAVVLVSVLMRTRILSAFVQRLEQIAPNPLLHRGSRWIAFLFSVTLMGSILTMVIRRETYSGGVIDAVFDLLEAGPGLDRHSYIFDDILAGITILALLGSVPIVNAVYGRYAQQLQKWRSTRFRVVRIQSLELFTPEQLTNVVVTAANLLRRTIIGVIAAVSLTLLFSLWPITEGIARMLLETALLGVESLWASLLDFLPNLFILAIIVIATRFALKLLRFFYEGLQQGKIRFEAIHEELFEPTYQILRFLVVAFALVAAFPYIPGSSSPIFKGLSIFVGFLLSLGSTSLVANIVSGIVLTYTRGLKIGDRVKIGESIGDVVDRTLLVTRVRTIKNVVISIPNAIVMQNQIINYSAEVDERGLILHSSVTIGYDVPWREVHHLLVSAAKETKNILADPPPFVLKTSLDDFYISYEVNAYTDQPNLMAGIYSDLHQNILDQFNEAGVEILSPSYMAVRDGQPSTIPEESFSGNGNKES